MPFNPGFKALPGGEDLISIPEAVLETMSTDQRTSYTLVEAVKKGMLPKEMQEILCGPLCHVRWLTTAQRIVYMWTRKHGLSGNNLRVLESLAKFCLHCTVLTGLRILRT